MAYGGTDGLQDQFFDICTFSRGLLLSFMGVCIPPGDEESIRSIEIFI